MPRRAPCSRSLIIVTVLLLSPVVAAAQPPAQRAWALAATALLFERGGERHDLLAGVERTPGDVVALKRLLRDWWGVTDRATLLDSLRWVAESGHRTRFAATGARLAAMAPAERAKLEAQRRQDFRLNQVVGAVELHYSRLGATGILGWDLVRFLALCRWGFGAGYLTEQEAWDAMIPVAGILRHTFTSWRDLAENYMIGRQFWDPEEHVRTGQWFRNAMDRLLSDPDSPWNRVPWDLDFSAPGAPPVR
jgi:hypothetical protein